MGQANRDEIHYVNAIAEEKDAALASYDRLQANFTAMQAQNEEVVAGLLRRLHAGELRLLRASSPTRHRG